jgi:exodeoxyribonuclease-3
MKLLTYNTLSGGFDGADDRRRKLQHEVIRKENSDVLLIQEAKNFDADGARLLFEMERALGMRGLLGIAPHTGQNTAIFFRPGIEPISFEVDAVHFHHAASIAQLRIPDCGEPITFVSVHLCPNGPTLRWREASYLVPHANPDKLAVVAGDFNSVSPHDPEPSGWDKLPSHFRARYILPGQKTADRDTLRTLYDAGFVDVAHQLGQNNHPTVPGGAFTSAEFIPFRCDHVVASSRLAVKATHYRVIKDDWTDAASDHLPIAVEFSL